MIEPDLGSNPFAFLATDAGAALLEALAGFDEERMASAAQRARSLAPPDVASAALATAFARRRAEASGKFADARSMLFTRAGYEQSTSDAVARHRAERFKEFDRVKDLCCGIGSDSIALARQAHDVEGFDTDPDAIACATNNARTAGVSAKVEFALADATRVPLDDACAAFADPSRRRGAQRARDPAEYVPPLSDLLARARELPSGSLCIKVAPGIDLSDRTTTGALGDLPVEAEFISERGVCKEASLWCGALARADGARRATVIGSDGVHIFDGDPSIGGTLSSPREFVGEPDPAVIRAGLIGALCAAQDLRVLDRRVAYLTADAVKPGRDPFVRWYRLRDELAFGAKRVRAYLRERDIGALTIKTRAFPLTPDELSALLKPHGAGEATLICTTIQGKKTAIICDRL